MIIRIFKSFELSGMAFSLDKHCCWVHFKAKTGELAVVACLSIIFELYVTESTKTGLIAYRQVLRKAGFNYLKCCSSPMAEATSIEFSHIIQQCLTFKTIL